MGRAAVRAAGCDERPAARFVAGSVEDAMAALVRASDHVLTDYQRAYLADPSPLRAVLKARQMGFSWLFALEGLAHAIADNRFSIFVSLNREEAAEKILYARDMYDALSEGERPDLLRAGAHEMRLAGGGRLLSFPCRAPRGKAGASLYLDEMAFYPHPERVYAGALPVISHGGRVTLASTPCGDRGMFWRAVMAGELAGEFSQHRAPWWLAPWFSTDVEEAAERAEAMETDERVRRYATPVLARLRAAMERAAFQQEYEMVFLDADEALISWPEIEAAAEDYAMAPDWRTLAALGIPLYAGMDVGRTHDPTDIVVVSAEGDAFRVRGLRTLRQTPYDQQEEEAAELMARAPVACLCVDAGGIGGPVSESLARRFPGRVLPVAFSNTNKESMAARLHYLLQNGRLKIPRCRPLMEQIHAVRRGLTDAGRTRLDAPRDAEHHADQFWALAMALWVTRDQPGSVSARSLFVGR